MLEETEDQIIDIDEVIIIMITIIITIIITNTYLIFVIFLHWHIFQPETFTLKSA